MVARKSEYLNLESFKTGWSYTREEIAQIGRVAPLTTNREWTGIVEFKNCVLLFSTLDKKDLPPEHNYADIFQGREFRWESQNKNSQSTPVIETIMAGGAPVQLFCRLRAKDLRGRAIPFIYVGALKAKKQESDRPVKVTFEVLSYQLQPSPDLAALYSWKPR